MHTRLKHLSRLGVLALMVAESVASFAQTDNSGVDAETVALEASHLKRDKHAEVDLPGFTTAMDGGSAGAAGSGSSKNLEGLSRVKLIAISWTNAPLSILSFARDTVNRTQQAAVGGSWSKDALTLKTDLSYTKSFNNLFFSGPVLSGTAATFNQELSGSVPATGISYHQWRL